MLFFCKRKETVFFEVVRAISFSNKWVVIDKDFVFKNIVIASKIKDTNNGNLWY